MTNVIPFPARGLVPLPLPPRDQRFVPAPPELCQLAGVWNGTPPPAECDPLSAGWDAEEKHDGIRALWIDGELRTREGMPLDIPHVAAELRRLETRFGERMFFDGEYQEPGGFLDTLAWLKAKDRAAAGTFYLFDAVPREEWRRDACDEPLSDRRAMIRAALGDWVPAHVRRVVAVPVVTRADVECQAQAVWGRGGEGIMLKDPASLYRRARVGAWLKLKRELRLSGPVVEIRRGGATAVVEIGGHRVCVPMRGRTLTVGMIAQVVAMEWTAKGALRHARIVAMGEK